MSTHKHLALVSFAAALIGPERVNEIIDGTIEGELEKKLAEVMTFHPKPPSGTTEYWFNAAGEFSDGTERTPRMRRDQSIFYCCAINDKNAIRKFNKWKAEKK